jgi:signal transduction histidine kinase
METWSFHQVISHKFRTPLNGVGGMLELLLDDPGHLANSQARELALGARESARRLEEALLSILRYHRIFCGGEVAVASSPRALGELWRAAATEAGVEPGQMRLSGQDDLLLPPAAIEPVRMVLCELAGNYLKFADVARGGLEAHFERQGGQAALRLFAPGPALSPELIAHLGRPYWQVEKRFTGEVPGVGLGLATCRLLLASLGGELRFSSEDSRPGLVSQILIPLPS